MVNFSGFGFVCVRTRFPLNDTSGHNLKKDVESQFFLFCKSKSFPYIHVHFLHIHLYFPQNIVIYFFQYFWL